MTDITLEPIPHPGGEAQPVKYPVATERDHAQPTVAETGHWRTVLTDSFGLIGVVWGVALAVLVVGIPIALGVALLRWLGRWALGTF